MLLSSVTPAMTPASRKTGVLATSSLDRRLQTATPDEMQTSGSLRYCGITRSILDQPVVHCVIVTSPPGWVRSIAMSASVCLSARISQRLHVQTSRNILHVLNVAVARSSSDDNAIFYVQSGFVDDFMVAHNRPGKCDANRAHTQSDSPGGSTGCEV